MTFKTLRRVAIAFVAASAIAAGIGWACGPFIVDVSTVAAAYPPDPETFQRGELGVIHPEFRRRYLAEAYRVLNGKPGAPIEQPGYLYGNGKSWDAWQEARKSVAVSSAALPPGRTKRIQDYMAPMNCLEDAYATATRTLLARKASLGESNPEFRDWVRAQDAVFANCDEEPLLLPAAAPASASPLIKADRAYQTAAAYFYAMQYDEAVRRFRAIAADGSSPWRPYGRFLAARALIRTYTMSPAEPPPMAPLAEAEKELLAVIADPIAEPVRESARGLLTFVRLRLRPRDELKAVATRIAGDDTLKCCAFTDLTYLLDHEVGDTVDFSYSFNEEASFREAHDLVDWIVAIQGGGQEAVARAVDQWQRTRSLPWLVAALARVRGPHPAAAALLAAAARVPASSPGYVSVSFYRVRLLLDLGRIDAARAVLAELPEVAGPGISYETASLFRAERFMVARTFEELLQSAARQTDPAWFDAGYPPQTVFDADAGAVFNERLPLGRLMEAAESPILPERLRTRVTAAAFVRAILLNRPDSARRIASLLSQLAPQLAADLERYMNESTPDGQRRASTLLFLRTPGLTWKVRGMDDTATIDEVEPRRIFDNFMDVWWCASPSNRAVLERGHAKSTLIETLYQSESVPYPPFITPAERRATERELNALDSAGFGTTYLATEALAWARQRPTDPDAGEALGRIVEGWHRACRDQGRLDLPRRAFAALHRQFPDSTWAKRNKIWLP